MSSYFSLLISMLPHILGSKGSYSGDVNCFHAFRSLNLEFSRLSAQPMDDIGMHNKVHAFQTTLNKKAQN